jgi:hypothetical protein
VHISDTHVLHLDKENMYIITVDWLEEYWMHISRIHVVHLNKEKIATANDGIVVWWFYLGNDHVVEIIKILQATLDMGRGSAGEVICVRINVWCVAYKIGTESLALGYLVSQWMYVPQLLNVLNNRIQ